jgi:ABC-type nitrate/sulfonate/bicarbonate transport system ATPase subunit
MTYLKIDHVDKTFTRGSQETEVLSDVTVEVAKGDYVSIIGHSGCGKSTLLNIVAGLTTVTRGAVLLENREVNDPGPTGAVVFQNHSLLPWLTVYDNVASPSTRCSRLQDAAPSGTIGSCTISISCRWGTPRTSGRRRSRAA